MVILSMIYMAISSLMALMLAVVGDPKARRAYFIGSLCSAFVFFTLFNLRGV